MKVAIGATPTGFVLIQSRNLRKWNVPLSRQQLMAIMPVAPLFGIYAAVEVVPWLFPDETVAISGEVHQ